ncbi:MAG: hypothetical protein EA359_08050 [Balneolaceae bacterium]|nr:MAG: hypothetical protein EA359_08050 [Balneolaceae bacterium]
MSSAVKTSLLLFLIFTMPVMSQARQDSGLEYRAFRVTLIPGLGSNGIEAHRYTAKYSLNILGGFHGGLEGYEIGIINLNERYTTGFQLGALNASGGEMTGVNIAAIANLSRREMTGIQFASIANAAEGELVGIQAAGFINTGFRSVTGLQVAGIGNLARGDMLGLQFAGLFNASAEDARGLMVAGFGNVNADRAQGFFIAGVANLARDTQGVTIAGLLNATRRMQGFQLSGLANIAYRVQGMQIGLINYAHDFEGIPVGLISYYGNGRKNMDTWISDGGFQNIGIKLGTSSIYNMLFFGYNPLLKEREVWSVGWSIGSYTPLDEAWNHHRYEGYFRMRDFTIQQVQEGRQRVRLNTIYSYRYLLGKDITNRFGIYAGPSLNFLLSREARSNEYSWYSIFRGERGGSDFAIWVGFTVGMQFFGH